MGSQHSAGDAASTAQLRRVLGLPALVFFGLVYMVPLTIFTTYGIVTELTGGRTAGAYLVTLLAMLFTAAKAAHLHNLPQGQPERLHRTQAMVSAMDEAGFGNCSNHYECEAACPKDISRDVMAQFNRDYAKATFVHRDRVVKSDGAG